MVERVEKKEGRGRKKKSKLWYILKLSTMFRPFRWLEKSIDQGDVQRIYFMGDRVMNQYLRQIGYTQ
jgi:hypothetical protein